jgi:hypothetical protein
MTRVPSIRATVQLTFTLLATRPEFGVTDTVASASDTNLIVCATPRASPTLMTPLRFVSLNNWTTALAEVSAVRPKFEESTAKADAAVASFHPRVVLYPEEAFGKPQTPTVPVGVTKACVNGSGGGPGVAGLSAVVIAALAPTR